MSKYFQAYETRRKLKSFILPGFVWRHNRYRSSIFKIERVQLECELIYGKLNGINDVIHFSHLLNSYIPLEQTHEEK